MDSLTSTTGIVALAGAAVALVAFATAVVLAFALRRTRAAQRAVLGAHGERDLVAHAASLEQDFAALSEYLQETTAALDARLATVEQRLDGSLAHRALVRYDAYNEMSGRQSLSIALLDETRSGIVVSSIHHRDQARLYAKQLRDGHSELELSPEEEEAVRLALSGGGSPQ